jgi:hypothetical protein
MSATNEPTAAELADKGKGKAIEPDTEEETSDEEGDVEVCFLLDSYSQSRATS